MVMLTTLLVSLVVSNIAPFFAAGTTTSAVRIASQVFEDGYVIYLPNVQQGGTVITVSTTADELNADGDCSLREAIRAANLDQAVDACPAGAGVDSVRVPAGNYRLTLVGSGENTGATGDLDISSVLRVEGAGRTATLIDGEYDDRVFDVHEGASALIKGVSMQFGMGGGDTDDRYNAGCGGGILNLGRLTLRNAAVRLNRTPDGAPYDDFYCGDAMDGGGICNGKSGYMLVVDTLVYGNETGKGAHSCYRRQGSGGSGGGVYNGGEMSVVHSAIFGNVGGMGFPGGTGGSGGGIANTGVMEVISSTVSENETGSGASAHQVGLYGGAGDGGGIANHPDGVLRVVASSIYSNVTGVDVAGSDGGWGGGIFNNGRLTVINSTISGNQASENGGGGVYVGSILGGAAVTITSSTVAGNSAATHGGGVCSAAGDDRSTGIRGVLLAANTAGGTGPDCYGAVTSYGYNILQSDAGCSVSGSTTGNIANQVAQLLPLADWGGPTWTHNLAAASPAVNTGNCGDLSGEPIPVDQRGVPRPQGPACDIGAVEYRNGQSYSSSAE
jgi:CSLREA domain-containing protein